MKYSKVYWPNQSYQTKPRKLNPKSRQRLGPITIFQTKLFRLNFPDQTKHCCWWSLLNYSFHGKGENESNWLITKIKVKRRKIIGEEGSMSEIDAASILAFSVKEDEGAQYLVIYIYQFSDTRNIKWVMPFGQTIYEDFC